MNCVKKYCGGIIQIFHVVENEFFRFYGKICQDFYEKE